MERIEEIRKRLKDADIKGPLTAELDIFDPDGLEIVASVFDEKLTFLYTSGSGVIHKGDTQAERDACWEAAKAALPVAELFANAPADLTFLLAEVDRLRPLAEAAAQYEQAMLATREKLAELRQQLTDSEEE